jgi:CRP/FNR family transcriptional regulator/CRP/FNR family cyclic AMP-dependent transcriptional regulator
MTLIASERLLIKKLLTNVPVFKNFSESKLENIISDFRVLKVSKGETVFFQTDECTELYIILKGKVRVSLMSKEGGEFILTELKEGDFFGEMSLIDGNPRSATVIASEDSTFGVLERKNLLRAIKQDPTIAIELLVTLVERLRKATEREEHFAFLGVRKRLVKFLALLIEKEGEKDKDGFYWIKKRTHKEMASRIGASREAISKVLKDMVASEAIKEVRGHFLINPKISEDID